MNKAEEKSSKIMQSHGNVYNRLFAEPSFHFILLILLAFVLYFSKLAGNGLALADDSFYAQKAKELLTTGNMYTMYFGGEPSYDNPPFFMWLLAGSFSLFGVSEFAAKLPSALMGVLSVGATYFLTKKLYNTWVAFIAGTILATTLPFMRYARRAMIDVTLTFFVILAVIGLFYAFKKSEKFFLLWGTSTAIAILIKSALGFFPLLIGIVFISVRHSWNVFSSKYFLYGLLIALGIGSSWYIHQYIYFGNSFIKTHFVWLLLYRGLTSDAPSLYSYFGYFNFIIKHYWPWLPLLIIGTIKYYKDFRNGDDRALLILIWVSLYLIVMSIMKVKSNWYIMPVYPAFAIIAGRTLANYLREKGKINYVKYTAYLTFILLIVYNATRIRPSAVRQLDDRVLAPYIKHYAGKGTKLIAYGYDFPKFNNKVTAFNVSLLYNSDHLAQLGIDTFEKLSESMKSADTVLCIIKIDDLQKFKGKLDIIYEIKRAVEYSLIANKRLDVSRVKTWK